MTTSTPAPSTRIAAMTALASRCGINVERGYSLWGENGDVLDAFHSAMGAATYPTLLNIERKLDHFGVVSARVGVSVDSLVQWAETWHDALVDHVHMAATGYKVVDGELVLP